MRGVRLSHRNLRSYGLPEAARPLAARAIRDARAIVILPIDEIAPYRNSKGRAMRGLLRSIAVLQAARDLAQDHLEDCFFDADDQPPENEGLWFEVAVAIDNRLGVWGLTVEDAG
jgi:hypothetical protein